MQRFETRETCELTISNCLSDSRLALGCWAKLNKSLASRKKPGRKPNTLRLGIMSHKTRGCHRGSGHQRYQFARFYSISLRSTSNRISRKAYHSIYVDSRIWPKRTLFDGTQ